MRSVKGWLLLALTVGCGGGFDNFTNFCDAYAKATCEQLAKCPSVAQPLATECAVTLSGSICFCGMNAFAGGVERYHPERAQACVDAIQADSCATVSADSAPAACSLVYGLTAGDKPLCPLIPGPLDDGGAQDGGPHFTTDMAH